MCITSFLAVLVLINSASSSYDKYAATKGWWGNIHHLVQLISLANKEEYILVPVISSIQSNLNTEKLVLQHYLKTPRNVNHQIRFIKFMNLRRKINTVKASQTKLKINLDNGKEKKVVLNEIFMSINSILHIHHLNRIRLTTGFEYDTKVGGYLNIKHCLEIGMTALSKSMHCRAIEWTTGSLKLLSNTKSLNTGQAMLDLQSAIHSAAVQEV